MFIIFLVFLAILFVICFAKAVSTDSVDTANKTSIESVLPDELAYQLDLSRFNLSFAEMLQLPRTQVKKNPNGVCVYVADLPKKELGNFDRIRIIEFPKSEGNEACTKITFVGQPPVSNDLTKFIKIVLWEHGEDSKQRGELLPREIKWVNSGESWNGRLWLSQSFALELSYDEETNALELAIANPIYESSLRKQELRLKLDRSMFSGDEYPIVGIRHSGLSEDKLENFTGGCLKLESDNKFDSRAIAVYNFDNQRVGYIPMTHNDELYEIMNKRPDDEVSIVGHIWPVIEADGFETWEGELIIRGYYIMNGAN